MIEPRQRLYKDISPFVAKLVSSGSEEIQSLFKIKVEMAIEVTANELVDLFFTFGMQVLKLVKVSSDVQSVGSDNVRLAFDQMFGLLPSDFGHSGEHVG